MFGLWGGGMNGGRHWAPSPAEVDRRPEAAVVLHRAVDLERSRHVVVDIEELADRDNILEIAPALALVVGDGHSLVEALEEVVGVGRVNPQGMVVGMAGAGQAGGGVLQRRR